MLSPELNNRVGRLFSRRAIQHVLSLAAITLFASSLFFYRLNERALWSSHEGRAGQHAQLMLDTGHWGMPTLYYGVADYQKPPLYYWLVATVAWLRGGVVDEWAIRLPTAVAAIGGVWLVYGLAAYCWRPASGFVAAIIVASNLRYSWLARVGRIDMSLMLAVGCTLACFFLAYRRISEPGEKDAGKVAWRWMLAAYLAAAVAVMLKGPVGLVLPSCSVVLFLAVERQPIWPWRRGFVELMNRLGVWWGVPLVLAVAGPWFVWATIVTHGDFFKAFFLHHNWDRTLGAEGLKPEPIWYYVPQVFIDLFPWSILIPVSIWAVVRRKAGDSDMVTRFGMCWFVGMFVFLSLVRFKRHDYLLPLVPGMALVIGGYWNQLLEATDLAAARRLRLWGGLLAGFVCSAGAICMLVPSDVAAGSLLETPTVRQLVHETDRMVFANLRTALAESSSQWMWLAAAIVLAGMGGLIMAIARRPTAVVSFIALSWLAGFILYVDHLLPPLEPLREQRTLAELARRLRSDETTLYYYGREDQQLMFYLGPGTRWLPNRTALRPVITQTEPVFVVMELERFLIRQKDWPEVTLVPLSRNIDNSFGEHRDPAVLVTNEAGERWVRSKRWGGGIMAD